MISETQTLRAEIRNRLPDPLPHRLGVAVSGGSDSIALLHLLAEIAQHEGATLFVATVDHGLRAEAAAEAALVASQSAALGVSHDTLKWQDWDGEGNLQDQARQARYRLLTHWAQRRQIDAIVLGHTADDQAETVLMRLARSAGVTGLSAMATVRRFDGVDLLRPMLSISRARLRAYLTAKGIGWSEDPSNQDRQFDRIKVRSAMTQLAEIGISAETLSQVADNLAQAREALERYTQESAHNVLVVDKGNVQIDPNAFAGLPDEIRRRIVVSVVRWITYAGYPPRQSAVDQAVRAIQTGAPAAIGGCLVVPKANKSWICRELNAVKACVAVPGRAWDKRWILQGPAVDDAEVRAVGERGILHLSDWRATGWPRAAVLASPAVWQGEDLLAAPHAGYANGWQAELAPQVPEFYASILSH